MRQKQRGIRSAQALIAVAALGVCPELVRGTASITFQSGSSYTITHDADIGAATTNKTASGLIPVSGSMPTPSTYQYGLKTTNAAVGTGTSTASGSVGAYQAGNMLGFTLSSGSGISQNDPTVNGADFTGYSEIKFQVDGTWNINTAIGPTIYSDISFTLGGTLPAGDTAQVVTNLIFTNAAAGNASLGSISVTDNISTGQLPFPVAHSIVLGGGTLASNARVHVTGFISLRAQDDTPAGLGGILDPSQPLFVDMAAATPATWEFNDFKNAGQSNFNFNDDTIWTNQVASQLIDTLNTPNQAGARAKFVGTSTTEKDFAFGEQQTVGIIDIDDPGVNFTAGGGGFLFDTAGGDAAFWVRNTHEFDPVADAAGHTVGAQIALNKDLEVINDAPGPLIFLGAVSGNAALIKSGMGRLNLGASNSYTGGTEINAGAVNVTADGGLSNGPVVLNGGLLNINTPNPFSGPAAGSISVQTNGQVLLSNGSISGAMFEVQNLGCISGNGTVLMALNAAGGNLVLHDGAMIGHTIFDNLNPSIRPNGVSATDLMKYTYGLSTDVLSPGGDISVGMGTPGQWGGFGGDKFLRTYGTAGDTTNHLIIAGAANLDSLGNELVINVPIVGVGGTLGIPPFITKRGNGLVAIESNANNFTGNMVVDSGPIAIDGNWAGSSISVGLGSFTAAIGGTGVIHSAAGFSLLTIGQKGELHPGLFGKVATFANSADPTNVEGGGVLTVDSLSLLGDPPMDDGAQLFFNLDAAGPPNTLGDDFVDIKGSLSLSGTTFLNLIEGVNFNPTSTYVLMHFNGALIGNGNITLAGNFATDTGMGVVIQPNLLMGGTDVLLTQVPEPGPGMILLGTAPLLLIRRRKWVPCRC